MNSAIKGNTSKRKKQGSLMYGSTSDKILDTIIWIIAAIIIVVTLYPVLYTVGLSFSSRLAVERGEVILWPVDFTVSAYSLLMEHPLLVRSYINTIFYTVVGTAYSLGLTVMGGYVLSRKSMIGRNFFMLMITFTMLFSGGLIPTFMVINSLGLFDTVWAIIIPCAISQWNMIIVRTSMQAIPASLEESAKIDGANHWSIFVHIFLPLSMPVIATIGLFYAVGKWNDYFSALIYLNNSKLYPVQMIIRGLLSGLDTLVTQDSSAYSNKDAYSPNTFKAAVVVVTMLPIMCVYPFIQKYFVKGVMVGAIKG